MSLFAKDSEPQDFTFELSDDKRAHFINKWGLAAHALGDLETAKFCFDISNEIDRKNKSWRNLSQGLQNSAWVAMVRGNFPLAKNILLKSLKRADPEDEYVNVSSYSRLASTYHALGEISKARKNFANATEICGEPLYSYDGIYETDYLFTFGEKETTYERTQTNLTKCENIESPRDVSLCHSLLGLLSLPESISEARGHLKKVRDWTNQSGHMECIIRAHILAAEIAYCAGDYPGALSEATTGLNHAESCGFGQFAIDLMLQLAKINLAIPDFQTALSNARKALDHSEHPDCRYAWGQANALHICGVCHKELNEPQLAKKRLEAAIEIRKKIQHPGAKETQKLIDEYFKQ